MSPDLLDNEAPAWAIRLEAKVDIALAQMAHQDSDIRDHEDRIRTLEQRKTVTPNGLWTAVVSAVVASASLVAMVVNLLPPA